MPRLNGPITPMEDASAVSRDAGNPPVRFDVAGAGDGVMDSPKRARSRKRRTQPRGVLHTTAPVPDPTAPAALMVALGCPMAPGFATYFPV
jgi:hypothetical protein